MRVCVRVFVRVSLCVSLPRAMPLLRELVTSQHFEKLPLPLGSDSHLCSAELGRDTTSVREEEAAPGADLGSL